MKVVVVGDVGLDVVAQHDEPIVYGGDSRAAVTVTGGGAGANTALWLQDRGAETTLVARVGDDAGGRLLRHELETAGVRCVFAVDPATATCCVVVLFDAKGQRTMLPDRGANKRFCPDDVPTTCLEGADHLHLSGYVLLDPSSRAGGLAALARAKRMGLTTSVDPQAAALLTDPQAFLADVQGVDLLLPNADELRALTGSSEPEAARQLLDTVGSVAVTFGLEGAAWIDGDGIVTAPAKSVPCVDSTGAGDAFNAGFLTAWLQGASPAVALDHGAELGAKAVSRIGAQP